MNRDQLTELVIGLAIKVHRKLGPGLLESVYKAALAYEFMKAGLRFEKEKPVPVRYGDIALEVGFRCDFLVESKMVLECKATRTLTDIDQAQLLNYLKITGLQVGLLINFNVPLLKDGIKRVVNNFQG